MATVRQQPKLSVEQYRRLRRIYLKTARSFRFGCPFGPADKAKLRVEQCRLVTLRAALAASA
jgi:hypothetical protein